MELREMGDNKGRLEDNMDITAIVIPNKSLREDMGNQAIQNQATTEVIKMPQLNSLMQLWNNIFQGETKDLLQSLSRNLNKREGHA